MPKSKEVQKSLKYTSNVFFGNKYGFKLTRNKFYKWLNKYRVSYSTFILILIEKQCKNGWRKQNFRHNKHSKTGC